TSAPSAPPPPATSASAPSRIRSNVENAGEFGRVAQRRPGCAGHRRGNSCIFDMDGRETRGRRATGSAAPGIRAGEDSVPLTGEYAPSTSEWARSQAETFEASGGAEANEFGGTPIVVLTSRGARSGKLRKNPLMRVE